MSTEQQATLEGKIGRLMQKAASILGFEISEDTYSKISPAQARTLLQQLAPDPDFRELAMQRGNPIAEANIWLGARTNGGDIALDDLTRMANGLSPLQPVRTEDDDEDASAGNLPSAAPGTVAAAEARLAQLRENSEWASKAMQRGTAEARENTRLNGVITGANWTEEDIGRLSGGYGPGASAPAELRADVLPGS